MAGSTSTERRASVTSWISRGDRGRLSPSEGRSVGLLIERLDTLIDEPAEGPALIHGDLWSGNLHVASTGAPSLIDPSASFSHREAELG